MTQTKQWQLSVMLAVACCAATPLVAETSAQSRLGLALAATSGSVDVVLGAEPGDQRLEALLRGLSASSAHQVRFSTVPYGPSSRETIRVVENFIAENELDWHVCHGWWLSPDDDYVGTLLTEEFAGSMIFFDEGPTSDVIDNPNADIASGIEADAVFSGILHDAADRVREPELYYRAVNAIWTQIVPVRQLDPERQKRGGWVDGC